MTDPKTVTEVLKILDTVQGITPKQYWDIESLLKEGKPFSGCDAHYEARESKENSYYEEYSFWQKRGGWMGRRTAEVTLFKGSYLAVCKEAGAKGEALADTPEKAVRALRAKVSDPGAIWRDSKS